MELFPRVLRADEKNVLTITDERFSDGDEVSVAVQSMERYNLPHCPLYRIDENDRYKPFSVTVKNGKAEFEFTPLGEQRHRIYVKHSCEKFTLEVYSLKSDLYALNPYKGDGHIHSTASDGIFSPLDTAVGYYSAGFDYIVLTDHHKYAHSAVLAKQFEAAKTDFKVYPGEEVHNRDMGYFHIINYGAESSVNDIINADPDGVFEEATANADKLAKQYSLPDTIDKKEFAFRYWVSQKIREFNGVSVLAHPYWDAYGEYNMQTEMLEVLLKNGIFDALEVVDDDDTTGNGVNLQTAMYQQLRSEGIVIPIVGSSDCHNLNSELFDKFFTYAFCESVNDVKSAIKNLKTTAVERIGKEYRVYGEFRLVKYTRFLIDNFEPQARKLKFRSADDLKLAVENKDSETVKKINDLSANYRKAFFGR